MQGANVAYVLLLIRQFPALCVVSQVYADLKAWSLPRRTAYTAKHDAWEWDEWITLPCPISTLPQSAVLILTVLDVAGPDTETVVGGTTLPLFGDHG